VPYLESTKKGISPRSMRALGGRVGNAAGLPLAEKQNTALAVFSGWLAQLQATLNSKY
jgi:hypothetical protein